MTKLEPAVPTAVAGGRRAWLGLGVLLLPVLLVSMDISVLFLAMPTLTADLDPSASQQLWILDIYGFMLAGLLITMGNLGDRIGRRNILLVGATIFGLASGYREFVLLGVTWYFLNRTTGGLALSAVGESPVAADALGSGRGIVELVRERGLLDENQIRDLLSPENMVGSRPRA